MRYCCALLMAVFLSSCAQQNQSAYKPQTLPVNYVLVDKSDRRLYLKHNQTVLKSYPVALGENPYGHKQQQGDKRTPEGTYDLIYKNYNSKFYKSIMLSYPNERDIARAEARGLDPGGDIVIHGQPNGYEWMTEINQRENWTDGCIALTNEDMRDLWTYVAVNTPITIRP